MKNQSEKFHPVPAKNVINLKNSLFTTRPDGYRELSGHFFN
jgi:hypothetical protein